MNKVLNTLLLWQSRVILWLVYWLIAPVFALIGYLSTRRTEAVGWQPWNMQTDSLEEARRQW